MLVQEKAAETSSTISNNDNIIINNNSNNNIHTKSKNRLLECAASTPYNKTLNSQYVAPSLIADANVRALITTFSALKP